MEIFCQRILHIYGVPPKRTCTVQPDYSDMECSMVGHGQQIGESSAGVLTNPEVTQNYSLQMDASIQGSPNQGTELLACITKHILIHYQHLITIYSPSFLNV